MPYPLKRERYLTIKYSSRLHPYEAVQECLPAQGSPCPDCFHSMMERWHPASPLTPHPIGRKILSKGQEGHTVPSQSSGQATGVCGHRASPAAEHCCRAGHKPQNCLVVSKYLVYICPLLQAPKK